MLKIAEYNKITGKKIELSELEQFGFKLSKDKKSYEQLIDGNWWDIRSIDIEDRSLNHYTEEIGYWTFTEDDELLEITFKDLIESGYVEKVEE